MTDYKPISRSLDGIKDRYTVVVIGSGYGGGIAASRMARAGQSVCLLERGREILPGQYPNSLESGMSEIQVHAPGTDFGSATALFDVRLDNEVTTVLGCGLGGTSLINANVSLEVDEKIRSGDNWPKRFRGDKDFLEPYFERARKMLDPNPYPDDFPTLNKVEALQQSAKAMGRDFYRPPINVNFKDQINPFGVPQPACNLCGDCCSGCNTGAKNTTLMNYLPDAHNHGAEIFTRAHVRYLAKDSDGWVVHFQDLANKDKAGSVKADVVVVGAGALGSTEILLRSRDQGLSLSDKIGDRFSCNGDVLGFGYNTDWKRNDKKERLPINGIGAGTLTPAEAHDPGPCIAGVIDMRDGDDVMDHMVIEEGVIPGALSAAIPAGFFFGSAMAGKFSEYSDMKDRLLDAQSLGNAIQNHPGDLAAQSYTGPVSRSQTYLIMSCDDANGTMRLQDDRLRVIWPDAGKAPVYKRDDEMLAEANRAVRGVYLRNPIWSKDLGERVVTVHPLGGCAMADSAADGVVNDKCQVYAGSDGSIHEGLYVCDGSVLPSALGVNPLLTISAVSEWAMEQLAADKGWTIDFAMEVSRPLPKPAVPAEPPAAELHLHGDDHAKIVAHAESHVGESISHLIHEIIEALKNGAIGEAKKLIADIIKNYPNALAPGMSFDERMAGPVTLDLPASPAPGEAISNPYEIAAKAGAAEGNELFVQLHIETDNLNQITTAADHPGKVSGTVTCKALSDHPMTVKDGYFGLFVNNEAKVETWNMKYRLPLHRKDGGPLFLSGDKILAKRHGSSWWRDVTTLFTDVHDGDENGPVVARGIISLGVNDLAHQATTFKFTPEFWVGLYEPLANAIDKVYLAKFGAFFATLIFRVYGGLLSDLNDFIGKDVPKLPSRKLKAPEPKPHRFKTKDGTELQVTRYHDHNSSKGPVILAPGFGVTAASYATDTVSTNLVEVLTQAGYDTWLFDYRASPALASSTSEFNIDDIAHQDWPAAVAEVQSISGKADVQVLAHCVGSMSLLMSLLVGLKGVRSAICSQLTLHPVTGWENYLKSDIHLPKILENQLDMKEIDMRSGDDQKSKVIDAVVYNVPVPAGEECTNPVCHRVFSIFGPSYTHANLNQNTHIALYNMFGKIAAKPFEQLADMMRRGVTVDVNGQDSYLPHHDRLKLPIAFLAGEANKIFFPETSERTYEWLREVNPDSRDLYRRHIFEGYAHMDLFVGKDADKDIFPTLVEMLDQHN